MIATYVSIIRRRRWLLLAVTLLLAPAAFWALHFGSPEYESDASVLLVSDRVVDSVLGQAPGFEEPERRMATELAIFSGRVVASRAAEVLNTDGWDIDADEVEEQVEIVPIGFSRAIEVVGTDVDPDRAQALTDAVVTAYLAIREERIEQELEDIERDLVERIEASETELQQLDVQLAAGAAVQASRDAAFTAFERQSQWLQEVRLLQTATDASIEVLSTASTPTEPSDRLPAAVAVVLSLLGGVFMATGLVLLLDLIKDSVRTTDEAERLVDAPVLVEMPRPSKRSTARMSILDDPGHPTMAAARALRLRLEGWGGGRVPSRVLVAEGTGSAVESFIAGAALATACGRAGERTLLVADPVAGVQLPPTRSERDPSPSQVDTLPGAPATQVTSLPNLWSVRATSTPGEDRDGLLDGYSPGAALEVLALDFDVVVIVAPFDAGVFELIVLQRLVDVATLVCALDRTSGQRLKQVTRTLERNDTPVDGLIVVTRALSGASRYGRDEASSSEPPTTPFSARSRFEHSQ